MFFASERSPTAITRGLCRSRRICFRGLLIRLPSGHTPTLTFGSAYTSFSSLEPPGYVSITKIKSHQHKEQLLDPDDVWKAAGNDAVDGLAKPVLQEHIVKFSKQSANWTPSHEVGGLDQAYVATQLSHEVSLHLFLTRKERKDPNQEEVIPQINPPDSADTRCEYVAVQIHEVFPGRKMGTHAG